MGKKSKTDAAVDELLNDDGPELDEDEGPGESEAEEQEDPIEVGSEIEIDERPSRRDRRRGRVVDMAVEEATRATQALLDSKLGELRGLVEGALGQRQQQGGDPQGGGGAPTIERINAEIAKRRQQVDTLEEAWSAKIASGTLTPEERKQYKAQARQLQEEEAELIAYRANVRMGVGQQQRGLTYEDAQAAAYTTFVQQRHSDVQAHKHRDQMIQYAQAHFNAKVARGAQASQELQDEAFDAAREAFGLEARFRGGEQRRRPTPTREDKARYSGAGATGGGGGGTKVKVTRALVEMANTAFGHIKDPNERIRHAAKLMNKKK